MKDQFYLRFDTMPAGTSQQKRYDGRTGRYYKDAKLLNPCSEKLPGDEDPYSVLCCDAYGEMLIAHPFKDERSNTGYSAESDECFMYDCVAWMLLPKRYKEET